MLQFVGARKCKNEIETDATAAVYIQNIKYHVENNVWSLYIRSGLVY